MRNAEEWFDAYELLRIARNEQACVELLKEIQRDALESAAKYCGDKDDEDLPGIGEEIRSLKP